MAYSFFIDRMLLPVPPSKLQLQVKNQNKTINLINGDELNIVNAIGLRGYSFTVLLPGRVYPFAVYYEDFIPPIDFLNHFRDLKLTKTPFRFVISRVSQDGKPIFDTNIRVSLEEYKVIEDAKEGGDFQVDLNLKECPFYGTKKGIITEDGTVELEPARDEDSAPFVPFYTVRAGDSLWSIAKMILGDGERYPELYKLNRDMIDRANKGKGDRYTIHPNQVLRMPI